MDIINNASLKESEIIIDPPQEFGVCLEGIYETYGGIKKDGCEVEISNGQKLYYSVQDENHSYCDLCANGMVLCMDGEDIKAIKKDDEKVTFINKEGTEPITFTLSYDECKHGLMATKEELEFLFSFKKGNINRIGKEID